MSNEQILATIQKEATKKGLSNKDLGSILGCSSANISNVFCGKQGIRLSQVIELAEFLDFEIHIISEDEMDDYYRFKNESEKREINKQIAELQKKLKEIEARSTR